MFAESTTCPKDQKENTVDGLMVSHSFRQPSGWEKIFRAEVLKWLMVSKAPEDLKMTLMTNGP